MGNDLFMKIDRARAHMNIADYRDMVSQIILYKYLCEKVLDGGISLKLPDIMRRIQEENSTNVIEEAFIEAELLFQERMESDFLEGVFDIGCIRKADIGTIQNAIAIIDSLELAEIRFNELIQEYSFAMGKSGGTENTPTSLCYLIAGLLSMNKHEAKSVADQFCGEGLLAETVGRLCGAEAYYLQDKNPGNAMLVKIGTLLGGIDIKNVHINCSDVLRKDVYHDQKFDIQVMKPPFGLANELEDIERDERYLGYGAFPPRSSSDFLFLENIIFHMAEGDSIAAFMCTMSMLNSFASIEKIRKHIIGMNIIDAVIKIPGGVLPFTAIDTYVLLLCKNKAKKDIVFIDTTTFFKGKRIKEISESDIKAVCDIYHNRQNVNDICFIATTKDIESCKYQLGIEKYVTRNKVKKLLKNEELINLTSVAEVILSRKIDGIGKTLTHDSCKYPIDYEQLLDQEKTSVLVKRGDLVFRNRAFNSMYLVDENPSEDIYAPAGSIVIRAHGILPEYLYCFFKSDIGQQIVSIECPSIVGMTRLNVEALSEMKIPLPKKTSDEYRKVFEIENHLQISISAYNTLLANKDKYLDDSVEDILNKELATQVKRYKASIMEEFLADDIRELNACYKSKAYKATLILAGSILEAVLIDWLSEIDGKDYFSEDYMIVDKKTGRTKRADLIDYIDAIAEIERPRWMDEAKKAHEIRKKRNLVHAKLGIVSDEINDRSCKMVISYLKAVLKTRGIG